MPKNTTLMTAIACAALLGVAALIGCGAVEKFRGPSVSEGATSDKEARYVSPEDPLARPIQVGWTSARASYCGFVFNPDQLRADFLASEARLGVPPEQMSKIEHAYDYTRDSVLASIKDDPGYCNKERTAAIRRDLNRYLAGDYSPDGAARSVGRLRPRSARRQRCGNGEMASRSSAFAPSLPASFEGSDLIFSASCMRAGSSASPARR